MALALEPDMLVVGEAASGQGVLDLAATADPDVILMDLVMPGMDGAAATSALLGLLTRTRVVMLSMYEDAASRRRATDAGASAYVEKGAGLDSLLARFGAWQRCEERADAAIRPLDSIIRCPDEPGVAVGYDVNAVAYTCSCDDPFTGRCATRSAPGAARPPGSARLPAA
jgi:CheY-like chemotaxis protein